MLHPKPNYVVLNAATHSTEFASNQGVITSLKEALQEVDSIVKVYWRTATYRRGGYSISQDNPQTDHTMCQALGGCLDVSWTRSLLEEFYWDELHNNEPVYRAMNEALLLDIGFLPNGYVLFNRSLLMK